MPAIRCAVVSSPRGKTTRASGVFTCRHLTEGGLPPNSWVKAGADIINNKKHKMKYERILKKLQPKYTVKTDSSSPHHQ